MQMRKNSRWIFAAALTLTTVRAAGPEFEVASVRLAPEITPELARAGKLHIGMTIDHGRVDIGGMPLTALIQTAYRTRQGQVTGPDWMNTTRFDILAKMPEGSTEEQVPEMLQALLADRFKLTVHRDTKDLPGYALIVTKGGIKAKEIAADAVVPSLLPATDPSAAPLPTQITPFGGNLTRVTMTPDGGGIISGPNTPPIRLAPKAPPSRSLHLDSPKITFAQLATLLTELVTKPVVDMTETKSSYEISLDISLEDVMSEAQARAAAGAPGQATAPAPPTNPIADALVAAVQKLGLKLDSRKLPVEMIVVDRVEKTPSEN